MSNETYWIVANSDRVDMIEEDDFRSLLLECGVVIGEIVPGRFKWKNCIISEEAFRNLKPLWLSFFIWGIEQS